MTVNISDLTTPEMQLIADYIRDNYANSASLQVEGGCRGGYVAFGCDGPVVLTRYVDDVDGLGMAVRSVSLRFTCGCPLFWLPMVMWRLELFVGLSSMTCPTCMAGSVCEFVDDGLEVL